MSSRATAVQPRRPPGLASPWLLKSGADKACALLVAAALAGCATTPAGGPAAGGAGSQDGDASSSVRAGAEGRRGGYYLDDGPGERTREEIEALAALPDPVPTVEPLHSRANQPYRVLGNDYRPMTRREPFLQRGIASWYGRKFHGNPTSIGERYDMYGMTAAHPTLPIPSFARVTNLENGRSVVVRVNDRGPFLHGRAIDLSFLAAHKLGYVQDGSAKVEVELLDPSSTTLAAGSRARNAAQVVNTGYAVNAAAARPGPPAASGRTAGGAEVGPAAPAAAAAADPGSTPAAIPSVQAAQPAQAGQGSPPPSGVQATSAPGHYLQLGAFGSVANAEAASASLRRQLGWLPVPIRVQPAEGLYRVQAGPYLSREHAAQAGAELESRAGLRPLLLPRPSD